MFRRIFELEGFTTTTTGTNQQLGTYFSQSLPNAVLTNDPNIGLGSLTNTASVQGAGFNTSVARDPVLENTYATYGISPELVVSRQAACENAGSAGDRFDQLKSLANSQDPKSQVRCGWVYNNTNPQNGVGAFGISQGPFTSKAQGTWMWDLQEAKQKVHTDLCRRVQDCGDIDAYPYQGRCGYCKTSGKAIPIENGRVAYPSDLTLNCSPSHLITSGGNCPRPDPVALSTPEAQAARQTCDPLPNGNLTRDCLIMKAKQSGCSEDGTIIAALKNASDLNYTDTLKNNQAWGVYQSRAAIPMNEQMLRQGGLSISQALSEFGRLNDQAASTANSGLAFAARDLCLNAGEIDQFDFCTEIADATRPPFSLDCLQKEFLRAGGQRSGRMYPSNANIVREWNSLNSWADVKKKIQTLKDSTGTTDRAAQEAAMMDFLGVKLDDKSVAPFNGASGVEIFWFTHNSGRPDSNGNTVPGIPAVFLGRRITSKIPEINDNVDITGRHGEGRPQDNICFVWLTNFKVAATKDYKIRIQGDDGYAAVLNRPLTDPNTNKPMTNGRVISSGNEISNIGYFPPTSKETTWNLKANGTNAVKGFWFQGGWGLYYVFNIDNAFPSPAMLSLTQEAYAPMMNFEAVSESEKFTYGLDYMFGDKRLGDFQVRWKYSFGGTPRVITRPDTELMTMGFRRGRKMLELPTGSRIETSAFMKWTSFQTFTTCCIFDSVPANAATVVANWHFMPGPVGGSQTPASIRMYGTGDYKNGTISFYSKFLDQNETERLPFEAGVPYLIMVRFRRSGSTTSGVEFCIGKLKDIQTNPQSLRVTRVASIINEAAFEDINNGVGRNIILQGEIKMSVAWTRLYDYFLDGENLKREALDNWQGIYSE